MSYGFHPCPADVKIFVLHRSLPVKGVDTDMTLIVALHVDDLLIAASHTEIHAAFIKDCPYRLKDLGPARRIFGADISHKI